MCLLGMAAGVPRVEVLSDKCGGGVDERCGMGIAALATAAVMLAAGANLECGVAEGTQREHQTVGK